MPDIAAAGVAPLGGLATFANVATILGTAVVGWGVAARALTRLRTAGVLGHLNRADVHRVAVLVGLVLALLVTVVLVTFSNDRLEERNNELASTYKSGVVVIEKFGQSIVNGLKVCTASAHK